MGSSEKFSLLKATTTDFYNEINSLNSKKASVHDDIPTKILKETGDYRICDGNL